MNNLFLILWRPIGNFIKANIRQEEDKRQKYNNNHGNTNKHEMFPFVANFTLGTMQTTQRIFE